MGYIEEQKRRIERQFISINDSIRFIYIQEQCAYADAFNLVLNDLIFQQTHLLVTDALKLRYIFIGKDSYSRPDAAHITIEELKSLLKDGKTKSQYFELKCIGFGKKRFLEHLLNIGIQFDTQLLLEAQSPDVDDSGLESEADCFAYYNSLPAEYDVLKRSYDQLEHSFNALKNETATGKYQVELEQAKKTIEQQKQEIAALKEQLEANREKLSTISAVSPKVEKQGDSLLILGAVMECVKSVAKSNYTQESLKQAILTSYSGVTGISDSTLNKKFTEAKKHLKQRHTP